MKPFFRLVCVLILLCYTTSGFSEDNLKIIDETKGLTMLSTNNRDALDLNENPHTTGVWVVTLDRNNNEIWTVLEDNYDGSYTATLRLLCYIYGCYGTYWYYYINYPPIDDDIPYRQFYDDEYITVYDARFCFVIDGVRYGPENQYQECALGNALDNPLFENGNYFTTKTGYVYCVGIAFDEDGNAYVYLAVAVPTGWDDNFPYLSLTGDVDGDGNVTIDDVTALIDILLSGITSGNDGADVDGDGNVTIADVTALIDLLLTSD